MRRLAVVLVVLAGVAVVLLASNGRPGSSNPDGHAPTLDASWTMLDAQARCDDAVQLVAHPDRWPTECRWRQPGEQLQGQSFPPPAGPPPYDRPRVEIYVGETETREQLAHTIAHEYGHMHHTREATFVPEWLAARGLEADTPPAIWTEDYAEVFAALFAPPSENWRAPTPRPSPEALESLKARFFS